MPTVTRLVDSVDDVAAPARRCRLRRRPRPGGVGVPRAHAAPAAVPRRRGRRRQDRGGARRWRRRSDTELIRLQCYEGLDVHHAVYEWDYARQLLELRILEATEAVDRASCASASCSARPSSIRRPLLQAIAGRAPARPPVLLIDEIDRADEEFEGYLLELLSEFQITIPEFGTVARRRAAARDPDVQPHARGPRRAQAPLSVPVDRLSELRQGAGDRHASACRRRSARARRAGDRSRAGAARGRALQGAGRLRDARLGGGAGRARPPGRRCSTPSKTRSACCSRPRDDIDADARRAAVGARCAGAAGQGPRPEQAAMSTLAPTCWPSAGCCVRLASTSIGRMLDRARRYSTGRRRGAAQRRVPHLPDAARAAAATTSRSSTHLRPRSGATTAHGRRARSASPASGTRTATMPAEWCA